MEGNYLGRERPWGNPEGTGCLNMHPKPATATGPAGAVVETGHSQFWNMTGMENLFDCWLKARQNKARRARVQRFGEAPLHYLTIIQEKLRNREYEFGPYKFFVVREKKFRDVVDSPMKDRIVHWMLYKYLYPIWEPRFIPDTYGNLKGRGTHSAVKRLAQYCRSPKATYVLQLDISKYFYSINHEFLKERALRYIGDHDVRRLLVNLIDSFRTGHEYDHLFPEKSLFRRTYNKGMPIGNLSSQLFANLYLCEFDHWVKESLRVKQYIRYVDDMVIISSDMDELHEIAAQITKKLGDEGLVIHPKKTRFAHVSEGIPFLGYVVWPNHVSAGKYMRARYARRLRQSDKGFDVGDALQSYQAMFKHTGGVH